MSRRPTSATVKPPEVLGLRTYEDCRTYADRFMAKTHHDLLLDVFMQLRGHVPRQWREHAAHLLASRPLLTDHESEEQRARFQAMTAEADACLAHARVLEDRHQADFEADYRAVMAEEEGRDPLDAEPSFIDAVRWQVAQ